jgi:hypothetical protein
MEQITESSGDPGVSAPGPESLITQTLDAADSANIRWMEELV